MAIVAEHTGWNRLAITPESEIERDLDCSGDQARELLLRMEREFGIDMRGVDFDQHFSDDRPGGWPIAVALVVAMPVAFLSMHAIGAASRAAGSDVPAVLQGGRGFLLAYLACTLVIGVLTKLVPHIWRARKKPVTVQHLIDAARMRRWPFAQSKGDGRG